MMKRIILFGLMGWLLLPSFELLAVSVRIKDSVRVTGVEEYELSGIGLVVGLAGDGDRNQIYTLQALGNLLQRNNLKVPMSTIQTKNVAIVEVQAKVPATSQLGSRLDIIVSSLGDAKSLTGGILLRTLLFGPAMQTAYAVAQGPIGVNGFNAGGGGPGGAQVRQNHPLVGQVIDGARLIENVPKSNLVRQEDGKHFVRLELRQPDYYTAARMADAINTKFPDTAFAENDTFLRVNLPIGHERRPVEFLSHIEHVEFIPDHPARVLINGRTGTIVATSTVKIANCAVSHGSITISISSQQGANQPGPLAPEGAQTVPTDNQEVTVDENETGIRILKDSPTIDSVAQQLNELGVSTRDIIAIFQAMERAGALRAEIIYQ